MSSRDTNITFYIVLPPNWKLDSDFQPTSTNYDTKLHAWMLTEEGER